MRDILSTKGMSDEEIAQLIAANESAYPSRKAENDHWRGWLSIPGNKERLLASSPGLDINAAYISSCRSDSLNCGACAMRWAGIKLMRTEQ